MVDKRSRQSGIVGQLGHMFGFRVRCLWCGRTVLIRQSSMLTVFSPETLLSRVCGVLKCTRCGHKDNDITVIGAPDRATGGWPANWEEPEVTLGRIEK